MLKMTVEKVLWLLVLFISTVFAHNSTCSDLSWKTKAKQEKLTLYNAGDVRLVASNICLHKHISISRPTHSRLGISGTSDAKCPQKAKLFAIAVENVLFHVTFNF